MNIQQLSAYIQSKGRKLNDLIDRTMPVKAGQIAVSHFKDNFRQSGYVNNGLHAWKPAQRIGNAKGAAGSRKTLTSGRNHLMSSLMYIPGVGKVIVRDPVEYAAIHNNGGVIHPTVTARMRRFAWAKFYTAAGVRKGEKIPENIPEDATRWRRLALTKKSKLDITMPQRQFMGESAELKEKITAKLEQEIEKALF